MTKKKTGLGRGFDSLIPTHIVESEFDPTNRKDEAVSRTKNVLIQEIKPNSSQPRRNFDTEALKGLVSSIKSHGVLQPLVVTETEGGFKIIAGERRWRAAKEAGLSELPVIVRSLSDQAQLEVALIENLQREDLSPLEIATAFLKLADQFSMSYEAIAKKTGKGSSTVRNTIRLLGLPEPARRALAKGRITEGHARQILAIREPQKQQELLDLILRNNWTVRKTEQYVIAHNNEGLKDKKAALKSVQATTPETKNISKFLGGAKVRVRPMAKGGRLIIEYKDKKDLKRIADSFK